MTRRRPPSWGNWSARFSWVDRAAAYDTDLDRQRRTALEQEQVEAAKRHSRLLQAAMQSLSVPLRLALESAASPEGMQKLREAATGVVGLRAVLADARMAAAHLPALVTAERLTLGMSTERPEVQERPAFDPVAAAIVKDPALTRAASDLLFAASRQREPESEPEVV